MSRQTRFGWLIAGIYAAAFLIYSVTWAFTWDESYHLLASQLMAGGKLPYLDFCFPQTPLNAYWNAGWMRLLGYHWQVPHAFAALFTIGAAVILLLFIGIHNSWDTVTYIIVEHRTARKNDS